MTGPLLTARQVAELFGVCAETVLRWTRRGDLPAIRLPGGAIRYAPDVVDARLEAWATSADTAAEELSDTPRHARRGAGYSDTLTSGASDTRPLEAVTNEEDDHAS
jgi:excisionase family DNA binding protein